ncbi:hypothetical protein HYALB_00010114 [Hymenoscyphus albidus]|uniref:Fork-head domain-containing protein n=1 Tax=Hymenoscyphus albidus TaxID=595503 RepID=A0A9N9LLJ1_9HELO|nr:hypothetical protein HYALB_00010114 [Hymenoscyphus albidus]
MDASASVLHPPPPSAAAPANAKMGSLLHVMKNALPMNLAPDDLTFATPMSATEILTSSLYPRSPGLAIGGGAVDYTAAMTSPTSPSSMVATAPTAIMTSDNDNPQWAQSPPLPLAQSSTNDHVKKGDSTAHEGETTHHKTVAGPGIEDAEKEAGSGGGSKDQGESKDAGGAIPGQEDHVDQAEPAQEQNGEHDVTANQQEQPASDFNTVVDAALRQNFENRSQVEAAIPDFVGQSGSEDFNNYLAGMAMNPFYNSAQQLLALQQMGHMAMESNSSNMYLDPSPHIHEVEEKSQSTRISAYAKLEFADGEFYMNTYSIILGRDVRAAKDAMRREREEQRRRLAGEAQAREPHAPRTPRIKQEGSRYTKSIVSESGGILRDGNDSDDDSGHEGRKSRKGGKSRKRSKSTGSSRVASRRNSMALPSVINTYEAQQDQQAQQAPARRAVTDNAKPVDPESLRPSPHDCPLVAIHPASKKGEIVPFSAYKSISRHHVKIAFNSKKHYFEATILGRNGAFIDDKFCHYKAVKALKSGATLQIGGVVVAFILPDIPVGQTGGEQRPEYDDNPVTDRYSEGGKEMSFDFDDDGPRAGAENGSSEELSGEVVSDEGDGPESQENTLNHAQEVEDNEEEDRSDQSGIMGDDRAGTAGQNQPTQHDPTAQPMKKRGPGRPPKNGIMSKREQQLAKKEAQARERELKEGEAAAKPPLPPPAVPGKNKVGRPRKHPRPDTPPEPREKRKYTKRKPKEPKEGDAKPDGSGGDDQPAKEKKEKKPPKPVRSPSPVLREEDFTPEQLLKPTANYVTLIHEALSNSETGQMSLPQIYRAIGRKYPYFILKVSTTGWQSSVRHNLSQHPAFEKTERDGKGWMWAIVEGASIEKEKKKRASPPPQNPGILPQQPPFYQPHIIPYGMMAPPPGFAPHQMPPNYQGHPGPHPQHPGYMGPPHGHPMNGHPVPAGMHPQMNPLNSQPPPFIQAPLLPPNGSEYNSPYANKAPATTAQPPSHNQTSHTNPQSNPQLNPPPNPPSNPQPVQQPTQQPDPQTSAQTTHQLNRQPPNQQVDQQRHPITHQAPAHTQLHTTPLVPTTTFQHSVPTSTPARQHSPTPEDFRNAVEGSPQLKAAVERFKTSLLGSLRDTSPKDTPIGASEAIVNSAVNRVLGYSDKTSNPGEGREDLIMKAFKRMLVDNLPKVTDATKVTGPSRDQNNRYASPQPLANQRGTQSNTTQHPPKTTGRPAIMRPSFSNGINRPGPPIPRPPMRPVGTMRTSSGSPAASAISAVGRTGPSSASPAPSTPQISTTNGANTQPPEQMHHSVQRPLPVHETTASLPDGPQTNEAQAGQIIGQKRKQPDTVNMDDMPELKKLSTSGPPSISPPTVSPISTTEVQVSQVPEIQLEQPAKTENTDDVFKKLSTSGPPQLAT